MVLAFPVVLVNFWVVELFSSRPSFLTSMENGFILSGVCVQLQLGVNSYAPTLPLDCSSAFFFTAFSPPLEMDTISVMPTELSKPREQNEAPILF